MASTTCRRQLLECCDQLAEGVSRGWSWISFSEENPVPDRVQLQTSQNSFWDLFKRRLILGRYQHVVDRFMWLKRCNNTRFLERSA